jgi:MFS superfamily sulfate permease-like transporter
MPNQTSWVPGLLTLRRYQATWLGNDIVAGSVLTTMLVPVGIASAVASGVPRIYGLYATIVPLLAYALFGPSRILVLGPDSSLAAVILGVVAPLSGGDPLRAVALAGMMAVVSGIVCIFAGAARLGFVTELLSKPTRYGYMNGIALTVLISQLPKLFGFSIESDGPLRKLWAIGQANSEWQNELASIRGRRRHISGDLPAQEQKAHTGHTDRRGWRNSNRRYARPGCPRWRVGVGSTSPRPARVRDPVDHV